MTPLIDTQQKLGLALLPSSETQAEIYDFTATLKANEEFSFVCSPELSIPHCTLFQGTFTSSVNVFAVATQMEIHSVDDQNQFLEVTLWGNQYVFLNIRITANLTQFHTQAVAGLARHAEKVDPSPDLAARLSDQELISFRRTGYPLAGKAFLPHITLACAAGSVLGEKRNLLVKELNSRFNKSRVKSKFRFNELVVYKIGPFGSCAEILHRRKL